MKINSFNDDIYDTNVRFEYLVDESGLLPETHDIAVEERLGLLVDREVLHRENRRLNRLLKGAKIRTSMGEVGACWDNAFVEGFFRWFKA